jgi:hypothetical protein
MQAIGWLGTPAGWQAACGRSGCRHAQSTRYIVTRNRRTDGAGRQGWRSQVTWTQGTALSRSAPSRYCPVRAQVRSGRQQARSRPNGTGLRLAQAQAPVRLRAEALRVTHAGRPCKAAAQCGSISAPCKLWRRAAPPHTAPGWVVRVQRRGEAAPLPAAGDAPACSAAAAQASPPPPCTASSASSVPLWGRNLGGDAPASRLRPPPFLPLAPLGHRVAGLLHQQAPSVPLALVQVLDGLQGGGAGSRVLGAQGRREAQQQRRQRGGLSATAPEWPVMWAAAPAPPSRPLDYQPGPERPQPKGHRAPGKRGRQARAAPHLVPVPLALQLHKAKAAGAAGARVAHDARLDHWPVLFKLALHVLKVFFSRGGERRVGGRVARDGGGECARQPNPGGVGAARLSVCGAGGGACMPWRCTGGWLAGWPAGRLAGWPASRAPGERLDAAAGASLTRSLRRKLMPAMKSEWPRPRLGAGARRGGALWRSRLRERLR